MSEDLRRQRRNLLGISLILCFIKYGGISINKISVFGVEILFSNISAIFLALWLIWFYFAFRYYQYFRQEGVRKLNISYVDMMNNKCREKLKKIVTSDHPNLVKGNRQQFDYNILIMKKLNWHTIVFQGQDKTNDQENVEFEMHIKMWSLWKEVLTSFYQLMVNQSIVSDYIFPIAFAIFTIIYCNLNDWPGRISKIFY